MKRLFLILSVFCFGACGTDGTDDSAPSPKDPIVIPDQPAPPVFTEQGGTSTYRFTAKTAWTADVAATRATNWCSVSPTSGGKGEVNLSIATEPNDTPDERNATITLRAGSATKTFSISQKQKDALTVTSSKIELEAAGGTATVEVKANISFEYEIGADGKEWITYSGTRAIQTSRLDFNVAENDDTAVREGTITIRSSEGEETVKIYQEGAASALVLTQKEYTVPSAGETIKVEIRSNVEYEVTMPQAEWITESSSRAMSTHTRYFVVAPNEDHDGRSAEIVFTSKDGKISQKVSVNQVQKNALVVAQNSYTLTNAGGEIKIAINHNVDFDIAVADSWVTQVGTRGFQTDNLTFKVAENTGYDNRETKIIFTSKDKAIKQEVKVYQAQKNAIVVSKKEYTAPDTGGEVEIEVRANIDFTVEGPGVTWLRKVETRALTTHTLRYTVDANTDYDPRTATIKITNKDNNLSETVTVTQMQKNAIVLAKSEYEFGADGGALDFDVMTNVELTVAISAEAKSWITQVETRGLEKKSLHFDIATYIQDAERTGTITISGGGVTQTVKVTQGGFEAPADPNPASTDFKRRVLLTQFTGTGCGYCPFMVLALRSLLSQSPYDTDAVLASAHLFNSNDPAYLSTARLDQAMAVSGFPRVVFDMDKSNQCGNYSNLEVNVRKLKDAFAKTIKTEVAGGISVNSTLSGNTLVIRASVKSAKTSDFRVGAWLLEDGIYGKQTNGGAPVTTPGEFDTHDNCIRIADSKVSSSNFTGYSLGKIEKGATSDHIFTMTLDDKWVKEKCHLVVFITVDGKVNNVIKANIGEKVAFDYK